MRGIEGLRGKEPVGAVLTIGTKGERGNPIDRDRFYIKVPDSSGDVRVNHPAFDFFNKAAPEQRRSICGVLVHAQEAQCFEWSRKAQKLPKPFANHPLLPACVGDGKRARRLILMPDRPVEHLDIVCANELCEFAQTTGNAPSLCKPWARLLFQPVWRKDGLPTPLMKLTTQSWHSIRSFVGFFEYVRQQAALCGVDNPALWGLQFELTLSEKSDRAKKTRFPVLRMSPLDHVQSFLGKQAARQQQLTEQRQYIGLLDAPEQQAEVLAADHAGVTVGCPRQESNQP